MSRDDYEVGFGKPPKQSQFRKGQSGNPRGRSRKSAPTVATTIEKLWMDPMTIPDGNIEREIIPFRMIVTQLLAQVGEANRKAHKAYRRYEAFAKTKPALKKYTPYTDEEAAERYAAFCAGDPNWQRRKFTPKNPPTPEERERRVIAARIERMKAGLEVPTITQDMTDQEAAEVYGLVQKLPPLPPKRERLRPSLKRKPEASEIFDDVINSEVAIREAGKTITIGRLTATLKGLLIKAMKGDVDSADMLMDMHVHSLKHGDFVPEVKRIPR